MYLIIVITKPILPLHYYDHQFLDKYNWQELYQYHRLVIKDALPKNHRDTLLPTIDFYHTASKLQTQSQTERLAENEFLDHGGAANENVHMPVQAVPIAVL